MKTKLIKLVNPSYTSYIIVDDSEMLPDVFIYDFLKKEIKIHSGTYGHLKYIKENCKKITYSTEPLEEFTDNEGIRRIGWMKIKPLFPSEVEEAINGYSVEEMALNHFHFPREFFNTLKNCSQNDDLLIEQFGEYNTGKYREVLGYIEGFTAHQELVKDKLFTVEDIRKAIEMAREESGLSDNTMSYDYYEFDIINQLNPPMEWDVEFDEQGKLKLI